MAVVQDDDRSVAIGKGLDTCAQVEVGRCGLGGPGSFEEGRQPPPAAMAVVALVHGDCGEPGAEKTLVPELA